MIPVNYKLLTKKKEKKNSIVYFLAQLGIERHLIFSNISLTAQTLFMV